MFQSGLQSRGCAYCNQLSAAARMDYEKGRSRRKTKFSEVSATTMCRECGGVVVLSLTDAEQNLLSFVELRRWFFQLHMTQMRCVGKSDHFAPQGWGYYWNLDHVLRKVYPEEYEGHIMERGGRQYFGVDVLEESPLVNILRTVHPLSNGVVRRDSPQI